MKFEKYKISKLNKMLDRVQEIKTDLEEFTQEEQEFILDLHNEGHTLQHCLRWGEIALYDILEEGKE